MKDLMLNEPAYDLALIGGDLRFTEDPRDQVRQHIKQRLLAIQGEWFLDQSVGLPWFSSILGKHRSLDIVEALIREQIVGTPGVMQLVAFALEVSETEERTATITFAVSLSEAVSLSTEITL